MRSSYMATPNLLSDVEKNVLQIVKEHPGISRINIIPIVGKSEATVIIYGDTNRRYQRIGEIYGFPISIISEPTVVDGHESVQKVRI